MEVREPSAKYLNSQFKRTEAGDIPIDWIDKPIGDMAEVASGGTPSRQVAAFWDGDIPWVTTAELDGGQVTEASQHITAAGLQNSAAKWFPAGTLLIALYGQGKTRGKCAVLRIAATTNQACAGIKLKEGVDGDFVRHSLAFRYDYIRSLSNGGSQENLSGEIVKKIRVGMPSTRAEQRAVADALADADALIDSLEQLLTKKRQIKQGAMQELLTGKLRLPGFQGPWSEVRLGEVGRTYGGLTGKGKADFGNGAAKYITFMNVMTTVRTSTEMVENVRVGPLESQNLVQSGDLLFNGSSETPQEVALCSWVENCDDGVFLNSFCFGFRPVVAARLSGLFMAYFFRGRPGRTAVSSLAQGATRYNIAKTALLQAPLCLPSLAEQQAIAEVLSSMDTEIAALESRLTKARALKQAMAQALLTGRIRLVEPTS